MANTWLGKLSKATADEVVKTVNEVLDRAETDGAYLDADKEAFREHVAHETDLIVQQAEKYLRTLPKDDWASAKLKYFEDTVPDQMITKDPRLP